MSCPNRPPFAVILAANQESNVASSGRLERLPPDNRGKMRPKTHLQSWLVASSRTLAGDAKALLNEPAQAPAPLAERERTPAVALGTPDALNT